MVDKSFSKSYAESGVDITSGYKAVELMKEHIAKTMTKGVLGGVGDFGGLFSLDLSTFTSPVLVGATDGVGTKLKLAFLLDKHDTIGIDAVAMCVNDIIATGAKPLFFLDYIATAKVVPEKIADIVKGVSDGCVLADCAIIGGETAEMPGFYAKDEYDIAGFSVGCVDKNKILDKSKMQEGDVIIALPSSGLHSNGFSLVRKVFDVENSDLSKVYEGFEQSIGEILLTPTKIYVRPVMALMEKIQVLSVAHITGGGFYENIPRALPEGKKAVIYKKSVKILPIFNLLAKVGNIPQRDMFNTFNMGVGMAVVVKKEDTDKALEILRSFGEDAYVMGEIKDGDKGVEML